MVTHTHVLYRIATCWGLSVGVGVGVGVGRLTYVGALGHFFLPLHSRHTFTYTRWMGLCKYYILFMRPASRTLGGIECLKKELDDSLHYHTTREQTQGPLSYIHISNSYHIVLGGVFFLLSPTASIVFGHTAALLLLCAPALALAYYILL